jgi:phage gpG-like protein
MSVLTVDIQGSVLAWLEAKAALLQPENLPTDMLDEAEALLLNRIKARFLATTDPAGNMWVESEAARVRAATGRDGLTGFDTGTLFHSIQAYLPTLSTRTIGTDVPYAGYFHRGTKLMPPRNFMGFSQEDIELTRLLVLRRLKEALLS